MAINTIKDIIEQCTTDYADMIAFKYIEGKDIKEKTYSQLKEDSETVSCILDKFNLIGKHIALVGMSSYEWIISYLGTVNSGSVAVPLDASLPPAELYELLNRADVSALIYDKTQAAMVANIKEKCPEITHLIAMQDNVAVDGGYSLPKLLAECRGTYNTEIDPDKLCTLMYTSGTTGKSKGVMLSHRNLASNVEACVLIIEPGTVSMSVLPIHHSYCLTSGILKSLSLGSCICINDSMLHFARNFKKFKPEVTLLVPLIIETIYQQLRDDYPTMRTQLDALQQLYEANQAEFKRLKALTPDERVPNANENLYYRMRELFNHPDDTFLDGVLYFFINKTAYSGMIRYNNNGEYNVPFGRYPNLNTKLVTQQHSELLQRAELFNLDYSDIFDMAEADDFIFLDPPYDCVFNDYGNIDMMNGFDEAEHRRLATDFRNLQCRALMVIGKTPLTEELYGEYIFDEYYKNYSVNIKNRFNNDKMHIIVKNY